MGIPNHNLDALERRRLALEDNITELQKSLYHWRTSEAEYDGLREEIKELNDDANADDFLAVARQYEGPVVTEKEIQTILRTEAGITRTRTQIVDLLGRRIDYVHQNAVTMEKRLRKAEDELYTLDSNEQLPADITSDQGFPMSEIMEELDEEGNVISSSVNMPGDRAPELLEALKKAGVDDIPESSQPSETIAGTSTDAREENANAVNVERAEEKPEVVSNAQASTSNGNVPQEEEVDVSQPVSLVTAEDRAQSPVTDIDEPADEATLRREMLEYGIHEVGAIVAELELDEDASEFSISDEEEYDLGTEEEEDEDDFGRSHTFLSEEYHRQMRELEAKLNARGMTNMGKDTQTFPEEVRQEIEQSAMEPAEEIVEVDVSAQEKKPKKKVAFADDLDIAPTAAPVVIENKAPPPKPQASVQVLSDAIVERTEQPKESRPAPSKGTKKASRFKSARVNPVTTTVESTAKPVSPSQFPESQTSRKQANAFAPSATPPGLFPATPREPKPFSTPIMDVPTGNPAPTPPEGRTLADKLVEREIAPGSIAAPDPDELDEEIHRREIASEFYRMRNNKIQQQGGFVNQEEPEFVSVEEPAQHVSRFKAARVRP